MTLAQLSECPRRERWCGVAAHFVVPGGPGAGVDDAGWGSVEGFAEIGFRDVAAQGFHVGAGGVFHGVGQEADRVLECGGGGLEPDDPAGDGLYRPF